MVRKVFEQRLEEVNCRLIEIDEALLLDKLPTDVPDLVAEVVAASKQMTKSGAAEKPWISYLAEVDDRVVGTCAFKGPPTGGRVEIAYFTFPGHEAKGIATRMGRALLEIALRTDPAVEIFAQTLVERNASHRVLEKLCFEVFGIVDHKEDGQVLEWTYRSPS